MKVKIYGAGSIGNHLSHASRSMGWSVDLCDLDIKALDRTKNLIYPSRYGQWDSKINLYENKSAPKNIYDLIIIGTPPEFHIQLALEALEERPKAILIEKPICTPDLKDANLLNNKSKEMKIPIFVGYDHVVGNAAIKLKEVLGTGEIGDIISVDVDFREHWGGIFSAHPWLDGPSDSYLGFSQKGGGALCEHSHALNFWQYISLICNKGKIKEIHATLKEKQTEKLNYDEISFLTLKTDQGLIGRVVQDVVTKPIRKKATITGSKGLAYWICNYKKDTDAVISINNSGSKKEYLFEKTRPDDFIQELKFIKNFTHNDNNLFNPISLEYGLDTMLVISAAFESHKQKKSLSINYQKGYTIDAII